MNTNYRITIPDKLKSVRFKTIGLTSAFTDVSGNVYIKTKTTEAFCLNSESIIKYSSNTLVFPVSLSVISSDDLVVELE